MVEMMDIAELIKAGQSECIAWARCKDGIRTEVFESICAMANTSGGVMLLGIGEDGSVAGFPEKVVTKLIRGLIQAFENPANFNPVLHLLPKEIILDGKHVIEVRVPESADIHTMRGKVFRRRGSATVSVGHGQEMAEIYEKKSRQYTDGKIYPYLKKQDLDMISLRRIQKRVQAQNPQHPWVSLDEEHLLEEMNLTGIDYETGEKGLRFAAAILIGRDRTIRNIFAGTTFCIEDRRSETVTREYLESNLMDTYERMTAAVGEVMGISKAAAYTAEILLRKNYGDMSLVTVTMTGDAVTSDIDDHSSVKGNPVLARIFRESAMGHESFTVKKKTHIDPVNTVKTEKAEDKAEDERAACKVEVKSNSLPENSSIVHGAPPEGRRAQVLHMMRENEQISVGVMARNLNVAKRTILRDIDKLKKMGIVERVGPEKGGRWVVR